jgi:HAD superfamily hydrolase (TIGR01509 family)
MTNRGNGNRAGRDGRGAGAALAAVLFDLDGVLVDSIAAWHEVLNRALAERHRPPLGDAAMRVGWGQGIQADARTYFAGETVEALKATYDRLFLQCLDRVALMPGATDVVSALAAAGLRLAVVTNTQRDLAARILDATGLAPHFAAVAAGDEVPEGKPDPALVRLGASRLGVPLESCLFVGDTMADVEAGRRAPCLTVGLRIDADRRIETLPELLALVRSD